MKFHEIYKSNNPANQDISWCIRVGFILIAILFLLVGVWGGLFEISGAVLANGTIVLESNTKDVQHKEGGIIAELLVKEGDIVKQGQILARIDSTVTKASLDTIYKEIEEMSARRLRLMAERDNLDNLPDSLIPNSLNRNSFGESLNTERQLLKQRRSLKTQQKDRLNQQIEGYKLQIVSLEDQVKSIRKQKILVTEELIGLRALYKKKMITLTQLNGVERQLSELDGEEAQLQALASEVTARISQTHVQLLQIDTSLMSEVLIELKDTEVALAQLNEKRITAEDLLRRVDILSPADGKLQELKVYTKGGVIAPGEILMRVVPNQDSLIIDAMIDPKSIDQVKIGREARVRFVSFNTSTTPVLETEVDRISSDVVTTEDTKTQFYRARLKVNGDKLPPALSGRLISGMPVEVQITTDRRTPLSYILKPVSDQLARTFKND